MNLKQFREVQDWICTPLTLTDNLGGAWSVSPLICLGLVSPILLYSLPGLRQ